MKRKRQKAKRSLFHKIVNLFIGIVASIIVLLVLFLGISQTSTFRNYLKDKIVKSTNSSITGKLNLGSIKGTLLTTLSITDISLTDSSNETIFYSDVINIKVNPFALFTRKIHLREISINNSQLNLLENKDRILNIANLSPADSLELTEEVEESEKTSDFPFIIQANNLQLNNFRLVSQTFENVGKQNTYRYINFDDLIIDKFNLSANAIIDISENNYSLNLKRLSFSPNVEKFALENFTGIFVYQNKNVIVRDLKLTSDDSEIQINARLNNADFFNDFSLEKLKSTPADVEVKLQPFAFDDLSSFIPVTNLLGHKIDLYLKVNGPYGDLTIEQLNLAMNNTEFDIIGNVKNLHTPSELFLDVNIINSYASYKDTKTLLPEIGLPDFGEIKLSEFNAAFTGKPTNFSVDLKTKVNNGRIEGKTKLNLDANEIEYDINLTTSNLNLSPIIDQPTNLNSKILISGKGDNPRDLLSKIDLELKQSSFSDYKVGDMKLSGDAKDGLIDLDIVGDFSDAEISLAGDLNFTEIIPRYDFRGEIENLDLSNFIEEEEYNSNLNFTFEANGADFDLDSLTGRFDVQLDSSEFRNNEINGNQFSLQLVKNNGHRNIYLSSDFLDFTITGKFSLADAVDVLSYEAETLSQIIADKVEQFSPLYQMDTTKTEIQIPEEIISKELNFNYSFTFKDFELIAVILGEEKLDIAGSGSGKVSNTKENFTVETDLVLDYLLTVGENVIYLSNFETNFRLTRDNSSNTFDDLFGAVSVNAERIYAGSDLDNIEVDLIFNQSRIFFNIASLINKQIEMSTDGTFVMSPREQTIELDELDILYNKVAWSNLRPIKMILKPGESIDVQDFSIYSDPAALFVYGIIYNDGRQNINLDLRDIDGTLISKLLFDQEDKLFNASLNVDGSFLGTFTEPLIDLKLSIDSVSYGGIDFGSLIGNFNYENKQILVDAVFNDSINVTEPEFSLNGKIPIDLNYQLEGERFKKDDKLDLKIHSKNFNISALGNILPAIKNQKGFLTTELNISGTPDDAGLFGTIELSNGEFNLLANNLDYKTDFVLSFDKDEFTLDKAVIKNSGGTPYNGSITASGSGELESFSPKSASIRMNGDLAVLSNRSRSAQPLIYGDLFIRSDGEWVFNYRPSGSYFFGNIELINTNLTFVAEAASYQGGTRFNYSFIKDTTNIDRIRMELEEIVESDKKENISDEDSEIKLDYELNISTTNIAELEIILSQAVNQKLNLEVAGSLNYENVGGRSRAQGSFELLDGSQLEFFKTFEADGNIRFESEITDPYLDIVATYRSDYTPPNSLESEEVAVKLRLNGPVSQLGTNLANKPENISVYVGSRNIENDIPDERYDASDALSFILVNQFKADLTAENRQEVANQTIGVNTATSLLGSILTGFVNQAVGDVVNNIQLSQAGEYTKFAVSGRVSNFKYSFGGTTELFQDINKANLRVDYFFNPSFLIRLERKDPVVRTFGIEDKITELGLKYRFEF